ncbi:hypothetical protein, partial [Rhodococcus baikonurensis]
KVARRLPLSAGFRQSAPRPPRSIEPTAGTGGRAIVPSAGLCADGCGGNALLAMTALIESAHLRSAKVLTR